MNKLFLILFCSFMFSHNALFHDDYFMDNRSDERIMNRNSKIPIRIIEVSSSSDLSTGVYISDSWSGGFSYSQRYLGECTPDQLLFDSYEGNYSYFSECMAEYAVNEINYQLSLLPNAPSEIFELFSYHRMYDEVNFNSPDGHVMLSDYYEDMTINMPGYLNIVITNSLSIPNSNQVLAGTTYLYQDLFDSDGGLMLVESESTPLVIVHELGHVLGFPHLLSDYTLDTFEGDSILIEGFTEPNCQPNYMSSWLDIDCEFSNPNSTAVGDINGDGYDDIVSAFSDGFGMNGGLSWHKLDSNGSHTNYLIDQEIYAFEISLDDIDFDGDLDILLASKDLFGSTGYFYLYVNDGFTNFEKITLGSHTGAISIESFDMDGDNDLDIIGGSYADNTITIYLNNGDLTFVESVVSSDAGDIFDINPVDMDNDGDGDILASAKSSQNLSWYENIGNLNFEKHTIVNDGAVINGPMTAIPIDFDGDGDYDVASFGAYDTRVYLGINNGSQEFQNIYVGAGYELGLTNPQKLELVDIDQDQDLDFICAFEDGVAAFINEGNNTFSNYNIISTDNGSYVSIIDILNDGQLDLVVSEHNTYMDNHDYYISILKENGAVSFPNNYTQQGITEAIRQSFSTDQHGGIFSEVLQTWLDFHNFNSAVLGDLNLDGNVNVTDAVFLVNIIINNESYNSQSDLNNDGSINVTDIVLLVSIILSV